MKKVLSTLLVCMAVMSSCVNKEDQLGPDVPEQTPTDTLDTEGKYACRLPETTVNGKSAWLPGDQILVHGEFAKDQVIRTLTAADISADGKTCYISIEGVPPYEQKTIKSKYFAAYPGEMVTNDAQCKDLTKFNGTNALLLAGHDKGEEFVFATLVGGLAFTVTGDFDSYEVIGNNEEVMGYNSLTSRITESTKIYAQVKGKNLYSISGKVVADGKTLNHVCFSGNVKLVDGFLMTFYKDGTPVKTFFNQQSYEIGRDIFESIGDITSKLTDYKTPEAETHVSAIPTDGAVDLGAVETANCYMVTRPGIYSFKAVRGNSKEAIASIGSVEVLWETWGTTEEVASNSVVAQVDFQKDVVYFRIDENYHPGNAVIAARNDMGTIIWSWHIWAPETPVEEDLYNLSRNMTMDRNLGALVAASADGASPKSAGLLYQWGRKDPFVGIGDFAAGTPATVSGQTMTKAGGQLTTAKSIKEPTTFGDAEGCWNTLTYFEYWKSSKTMYDPCPPGYKVPYRSENVLFTTSPSNFANWKFDPDNYLFTAGDPVATYPLAGWISWDGTYDYGGKGTGVWTSRASSTVTNGYVFRLYNNGDKTSYSSSSRGKSYGFSVRCVAYDEIPFENAPGTPVMGDYKKFDADLQELSGLCLHTDGSFLWGVGDQGNLVKIGFDASVEKVFKANLDMEAVTIDPETGDLYLGLEPNSVYKILAPDYNKGSFLFDVEDAKDYENSGVEGITWYKDGMILVGAQTGANLWAYTLDGTVVWKKSLRAVAIGCQEIADLCYDPVKDQLWVIDSVTQKIYLFNGDASVHLATYDVGFGGNCESVYLDEANGCVWVADDDTSSKLFKIDFTF